MDYSDFFSWLVSKNGMSERSARDVISRSRRVISIVKQNEINNNTMKLLTASTEFANCSISIKSQLKRAVTLYMTFSVN